MKRLLLSFLSFACSAVFAQGDTARKIEPGQQTSFDKYGLLVIAIVALLRLMGLRIWFKRRQNQNASK